MNKISHDRINCFRRVAIVGLSLFLIQTAVAQTEDGEQREHVFEEIVVTAVYVESAAGTAAGGKTGLTATVVGFLFLLMIFMAPLSYLVPAYATAPALMYVGLLMLGNVRKLNFDDTVDALSGLTCAVLIVLTANIVTGIMFGFSTFVVGRLLSGQWRRLNLGVVVIAVGLVVFYMGGWAI